MGTIKFTIACHKEIENKIKIHFFLDNITGIDLSLFTNNVENVFVVFQSFNPSSKAMIAKERKTMRRKTKTLELYLILDYERIMNGTDPENLQHIKEVFVKGCETFLKPLKDFKWEEFIQKINETI